MAGEKKGRFDSVGALALAIVDGAPGKVSGLLDLGMGLDSTGWLDAIGGEETNLLHLCCASKELAPLEEAFEKGARRQWSAALTESSKWARIRARAWASFWEDPTPAEYVLALDDGGKAAKFMWGKVFTSLMNSGALPLDISCSGGKLVWRTLSAMAEAGRGKACADVWALLAECPVDWTQGGSLRPTKWSVGSSSFLWSDAGVPLLSKLLADGMDPNAPWDFSIASIAGLRNAQWDIYGGGGPGPTGRACEKTMAMLSGRRSASSAPPLVLAALCGSARGFEALIEAGGALDQEFVCAGVKVSPRTIALETRNPALAALCEERDLEACSGAARPKAKARL